MTDDDQDDLFGKSKPTVFARGTDPETSHAAARSFEGLVADKELLVLRYIIASREKGATWDDVYNATGMTKASISPRFKPLMAKGFIEYCPDGRGTFLKRPGLSGRGQLVHYATEAGIAYVKSLERP